MAAQQRKPEVGDKITFLEPTFNVQFEGTVQVLLSSQFIIHCDEPPSRKGKVHFIFYSDDWRLKA